MNDEIKQKILERTLAEGKKRLTPEENEELKGLPLYTGWDIGYFQGAMSQHEITENDLIKKLRDWLDEHICQDVEVYDLVLYGGSHIMEYEQWKDKLCEDITGRKFREYYY